MQATGGPNGGVVKSAVYARTVIDMVVWCTAVVISITCSRLPSFAWTVFIGGVMSGDSDHMQLPAKSSHYHWILCKLLAGWIFRRTRRIGDAVSATS